MPLPLVQPINSHEDVLHDVLLQGPLWDGDFCAAHCGSHVDKANNQAA